MLREAVKGVDDLRCVGQRNPLVVNQGANKRQRHAAASALDPLLEGVGLSGAGARDDQPDPSPSRSAARTVDPQRAEPAPRQVRS